ncbi:BPTD_3080 family restriction endonuclease [Streptomyces microflavus]|uniref:DEAD/DEAH box helicase family protein n=1 Tax=Streptomyces microflavus TaxID=1919 RepID=A0A7H8MMN7_STRMI|nr:DEAD/DEAH box helicase family protein [Streptomyces microflavus]QKW43799.1 DEAD/DEAH box helicase family protein [Streptomyces microflavus]
MKLERGASAVGTPIEDPIINSPYSEPALHWELDSNGQPTGEKAVGRRASESLMPVPKPRKGSKAAARQAELFGFDGVLETRRSNDIIAEIRTLVRDWRDQGHPNVTVTTRRLLEYWTQESRGRRLFYAQLEAVETAIYLTEVGTKLGKGWVGERLRDANAQYNAGLPRVALKMATGTGKTVVMAMLITWQVLNKAASPQDARFTKKFLLVAPGITIRDRLRVLMPSDPSSYYKEMDIVPADLAAALGTAQVAITNFHNFELKATREGSGLASTTKKLLLGKTKFHDPFVETPDQMVNRVLRDLGGSDKSQIIVLNDEAHHCYQTREAAVEGGLLVDQLKGTARKEAQELEKAARRWFDGLRHIAAKSGIKQVYDLSATPSFLSGSGYPEGLMFPWVVSDFGLLDAIESGLVKIPRVPVDDDAAQKRVSYLNLWDSIPDQDRDNLLKGKPQREDDLPAVVEGALKSLYANYVDSFQRWQSANITGSTPPVFIVVCANTKISRWVYDKIAGYETEGQGREGDLPLFSNYDGQGHAYGKPRTILVDSAYLEDEDAKLSTEFKAAAEQEIAAFHDEYLKRYPGRTVDTLTEKDLLREVLNTVGKNGKLGQDVRCVVSVSMLTEGWDANTVTHVLGIRAFGSSLLCEQVVGRALRRVSYEVNQQGLLDAEYAEVYGIPFQFIQTDPTKVLESKPKPIPVRVQAMPEREAQRIVFPRLEGYRIEIADAPYQADFSGVANFRVDDTVATKTLTSAVVGTEEEHAVSEEPARPQQVAYLLAGELLRRYRDPTGAPKPWLFPSLVTLTKQWLQCCVGTGNQKALDAITHVAQERVRAVEELHLAIEQQHSSGESFARVLPVFQRFRPDGSTDEVDFFSTKARYEAEPDKCPVNYVVLDGLDGNTWERAMAELLEALPEVNSYVKNDHLEFRIPYSHLGRAHWYVPDFIVRLNKRGPEDAERHLIVEVSGTRKSQGPRRIKAITARDQWCAAVNNHGGHGVWGYTEVDDPRCFRERIIASIADLYSDGAVTGLHTEALHNELHHIVGSEADGLFEDFFIHPTEPPLDTLNLRTGEGN